MAIGIESINYSLRKLSHKKSRSFLTIFSILLGIATIFIFISFGLGLYGYVNDLLEGSSADKIIIQARGVGAPGLDDTFKLTDDDLEVIENSNGVFEATGAYFKVIQISYRDEKKFVFLAGYDPKKPLMMEVSDIEIEVGRELSSGEGSSVVLGNSYLKENKVFSKPVKLNDKVEILGKKYKVVGFYGAVGNPQDDSNVYMTKEVMEDAYSNETLSYGMIIARVDPTRIEKTITSVEENLRDERGLEKGKEDFFVQSFEELISTYANVLNIIIGFIIFVAFIAVIVSAVNTANTMITSVLERYKEIGVIKSIGARNEEVFGIFLFESSFLGFIAGVLGVFFGWLIARTGGIILNGLGWGFLSPSFPKELFIGCILFAVLTGAISGVAPAIKASRINIVNALRYE